MYRIYASITLLMAFSMPAMALPAPEPQTTTGPIAVNGKCQEQTSNYTITSQEQVIAPPALVTGSTCEAGPSGCTIAEGNSYSVSITVTTGGSATLNFGDIASAGIDASVSIGTTNTTAITTSVSCPANCDCGLQAVAHMYHIVGIHNVVSVNPEYTRGPECAGEINVAYPYDVTVPQTIKGGTPNADARVDFSACRVGGTFCGPWDKPLLALCPGT